MAGTLDKGEATALFADIYGLTLTGSVGDPAMTAIKGLLAQCDTDRDGRISKDELMKAATHGALMHRSGAASGLLTLGQNTASVKACLESSIENRYIAGPCGPSDIGPCVLAAAPLFVVPSLHRPAGGELAHLQITAQIATQMWDGTYPGKQTNNIAAGVYLVKNVVVTRAGARSAVMYGGAVGCRGTARLKV